MSPLSVSMLRPPCEWFDVVIFDEASQILPADAITAIKAGKQVVVAGDDTAWGDVQIDHHARLFAQVAMGQKIGSD